jgi:Tfp pilus assembly protein PilZ
MPPTAQRGAAALASQTQVLEIEYGSARDFAQDFRANLANGGVFVATQRSFAPRDFVMVRLRMPWCSRVIDLEGEVVHIVSAEIAGIGVQPGVAVQFRELPAGIRVRLGPLCAGENEKPPPKSASEERIAPRKSVRVPALLESTTGSIRGRTRNLSKSGVLIDVQEGSAAAGERVHVVLRHPAGGEGLAIDGAIERIATSAGRVSALAVQFDADEARRSAEERFLAGLNEAEHTRRLGAITGPIAELGPQSIVQMLVKTAPRGTIYLRHAQEEGLICFEGGVLRVARLGPVTGMKALIRMLCWKDGMFEFHTGVDESGSGDAPLPLTAALFEAARNIDERKRVDPAAFPLQARLVARHTTDGQFTGALSKLEEALLDVAQAGFTVQRALEVIPEPDPEIFRALRSLIDAEKIELH